MASNHAYIAMESKATNFLTSLMNPCLHFSTHVGVEKYQYVTEENTPPSPTVQATSTELCLALFEIYSFQGNYCSFLLILMINLLLDGPTAFDMTG